MFIDELKQENGKISVYWVYQFKSEIHISKVKGDFKYFSIKG